MIKSTQVGKSSVDEYTLFAFSTSKGIFTLVGTKSIPGDAIDTFRNISANPPSYHDWERSSIKQWLESDKITPIPEAITITWYQNRKFT